MFIGEGLETNLADEDRNKFSDIGDISPTAEMEKKLRIADELQNEHIGASDFRKTNIWKQ